MINVTNLKKKAMNILIFNQFDQFGNSIWHYEITGSTIETLFNQIKKDNQRLSGFVSATGSAGTIAAGDYLREIFPLIKCYSFRSFTMSDSLDEWFWCSQN